ncbi:MAG TPA: hypothetical protein VGK74_04785 [Symbiobacteriaceae bacterium]
MARLITEQELTQWAGRTRSGPKYLLMRPGIVLTPGALDAARRIGVQILHPGPGARTVLKQLAEEVTGGPVGVEDLAKLEAQVLAKSKE